jgi:hypothetical protein
MPSDPAAYAALRARTGFLSACQGLGLPQKESWPRIIDVEASLAASRR